MVVANFPIKSGNTPSSQQEKETYQEESDPWDIMVEKVTPLLEVINTRYFSGHPVGKRTAKGMAKIISCPHLCMACLACKPSRTFGIISNCQQVGIGGKPTRTGCIQMLEFKCNGHTPAHYALRLMINCNPTNALVPVSPTNILQKLWPLLLHWIDKTP